MFMLPLLLDGGSLSLFVFQIQIKDLDIRVRPNFTGFALRKVVETLQELGDLQTGEVEGAFSSSGAGGLMERRAFFGSSFSSQGPGFAARPEVHNTSARVRERVASFLGLPASGPFPQPDTEASA